MPGRGLGKFAALRFPSQASQPGHPKQSQERSVGSGKRPRASTASTVHGGDDDDDAWDSESFVLGGDLDVDEANIRLIDYTVDDDEGNVPNLPSVQQLQDVAIYQEPSEEEEEAPTEPFDESIRATTTTTTTQAVGFLLPQGRPRRGFQQTDPSLLVQHRYRSELSISDYYFKMALWHIRVGTSRNDYRAWLSIQKDILPEATFKELPDTIQTMKEHILSILPLLDMRKISLSLNPHKIPTRSNDPHPTEDLWFFDPRCLFRTMLSSQSIRSKMYMGMGEFVDEPKELWHSRSWLSSVRTTSGSYARDCNYQFLLPSDFLFYKCVSGSCQTCSKQTGEPVFPHPGRILEVGKDQRSKSPWKGSVMAKIQILYCRDAKDNPHPVNARVLTDAMIPNEGVLLETFEMIPEKNFGGRISNVFVDHTWGSRHPFQPQTYPRDSLVVRRMVGLTLGQQPFHDFSSSIPLCRTHPIRGELEIIQYTRQHFIEQFGERLCISVPLLTFIDGFGLYRNMYRSLMGIYLNIGSFTVKERQRRKNTYPLTLGPHGSNFDDVIKGLQSLGELDAGEKMTLDGAEYTVCPFTLCFLGDMPEQAKNSGCLGPKANLFCRFCNINSQNANILTRPNIRTHWEMENLRRSLTQISKQNADQQCTTHGITRNRPSLEILSPALDVILTRPSDSAHSEFGGISRLLHELLMQAYLTPSGLTNYSKVLRDFPMPAGWNRLQNPLHHHGSYSMSEHGRWVVIAPLLLRFWLRRSFVREHTMAAVGQFFQIHKQRLFNHFPHNHGAFESIIFSFSAVAKACSLLMAERIPQEERSSLGVTVLRGRECFQYLCECAVSGSSSNPRSRQTTPVSGATEGYGLFGAGPVTTQKGREYRQISRRPNIHIGLHYGEMMREYALPSQTNVLSNEDMHRFFKKEIYSTNHRDVEKYLLRKMNVYTTMRFILQGSFERSHPDMTAKFTRIYQSSPELFDFVFSKTEMEKDLDIVDDLIGIEGNLHHTNIVATGRIKASHMRTQYKMPCTASDIRNDTNFRRSLREAYSAYGRPNIMDFHEKPISWCSKISFTDAQDRRVTFKNGDFAYNRNRDVVLIMHLFTHELLGKKYAFAVTRKSVLHINTDPVLNLKLRVWAENPIAIYALVDYGSELPYMVPIKPSQSGGFELAKPSKSATVLVHVEWPIQFL